jgi:hypothetical protein
VSWAGAVPLQIVWGLMVVPGLTVLMVTFITLLFALQLIPLCVLVTTTLYQVLAVSAGAP